MGVKNCSEIEALKSCGARCNDVTHVSSSKALEGDFKPVGNSGTTNVSGDADDSCTTAKSLIEQAYAIIDSSVYCKYERFMSLLNSTILEINTAQSYDLTEPASEIVRLEGSCKYRIPSTSRRIISLSSDLDACGEYNYGTREFRPVPVSSFHGNNLLGFFTVIGRFIHLKRPDECGCVGDMPKCLRLDFSKKLPQYKDEKDCRYLTERQRMGIISLLAIKIAVRENASPTKVQSAIEVWKDFKRDLSNYDAMEVAPNTGGYGFSNFDFLST